jgi:O-antigen/teichoic acid export membrane protein
MKGLISLLKSKSFISLLGNGVSALLGLLSFALLARYTSKQEFGIWIIFLTIYGIFDTLRTGMVLNAFIKNYTQAVDNKERHQVIGSSWQLSIYVNFAYAVIIAFIYAIFFFYNILPNYHSFFFWLLIISVFSLPFNFATWLLNAELHIFQMSLARIYNQMLFIVLAIVLLFYFSFDKIVSILIAYSLAQLLTTIICIIKGWTGIQYYKNRTKAGLQDLFQFGKFSMGTLVGSNLLKGSDSFLIGKFLGTVAVATYNVPSRVVDVFDLVVEV